MVIKDVNVYTRAQHIEISQDVKFGYLNVFIRGVLYKYTTLSTHSYNNLIK